MRPILTYYGGKQRMVPNLLPLIPPHKIYVEPFCGGASLFFAKDRPIVTNQNDYLEVLNDIDGDLVNFYMVCKKHPEIFNKRLSEYPYAESIYKHFKSNNNHKNPITRAVGYYIRIMMSFTHKLDAGFAFGKKSKNIPMDYKTKLQSINNMCDRLILVTIFNREAISVIKLFDTETTFFYCDPPYPGTDQGAYSGYTQDHFVELTDMLSECKGSFMLSCYPNEAVPKDWEKHEFKMRNYCSNTAKGGHRDARTECVWRRLSPWAQEQMQRVNGPTLFDILPLQQDQHHHS